MACEMLAIFVLLLLSLVHNMWIHAYKRMYVQSFFLKNEQHRASFVYNDPHHRRPHSGRRQNLIRSRLYSIIRTLTLCTAVQEEKGLEI